MEASTIIEIVKSIGLTGGAILLINWRLKKVEDRNEKQEKQDIDIIKEIGKVKSDLIMIFNGSIKRVHERIDDHKDHVSSEFTKVRAEYVSESHCNSKMSK